VNLLDVSVNLELAANVRTIRTTVYVGGRAVAMAANVVSEEQAADLFTRDLMVSAQLGEVARFIAKNGVPNDVSVTATPDVGAQGNRTSEALGQDPARTA
jgi:hypothetical protein